ncbi:hypothetical protein PHBOTO_003633 [Pseudozyma hubeiensis]|nr:hypothetical protein PHBOTO_003633 [Pseudozyma hubeiensis]
MQNAVICGEADKKDSGPSASFPSVGKVHTQRSHSKTEDSRERCSVATSGPSTRHGPDMNSLRDSCLNGRNLHAI